MALAQQGEPLKLADGTLILPNGRVQKELRDSDMVAIPSNTEARRLVAKTRRRLSDLPAIPRQMNVISVVVTYTMLGISDEEIAIATELSAEQIKTIKTSEVYASVSLDIAKNIVAQDTDAVRTRLEAAAHSAADKVVTLMDSPDDKVALGAIKDVLDRAGHRPVDVVEHRHSMDGGLVIRVIKQDNTVKMPELTIDHGAI